MFERLRRRFFNRSEAADQAVDEFRNAWSGRRVRTLQKPLAVSVSELIGLPDAEAIGISLVPTGFEDKLSYLAGPHCPLCGEETGSDSPRAIVVHVRFRGRDSLYVPAWGHSACVDGCPETDTDAGVPWSPQQWSKTPAVASGRHESCANVANSVQTELSRSVVTSAPPFSDASRTKGALGVTTCGLWMNSQTFSRTREWPNSAESNASAGTSPSSAPISWMARTLNFCGWKCRAETSVFFVGARPTNWKSQTFQKTGTGQPSRIAQRALFAVWQILTASGHPDGFQLEFGPGRSVPLVCWRGAPVRKKKGVL